MKDKSLIILMILMISLFVALTPALVCADETAGQPKAGVVDVARVEVLKQIQAANEEAIFHIPGIVGIGIGLMENGRDLGFVVYCEKLTPEVSSLVPHNLEGAPVRLIESGVFRAY